MVTNKEKELEIAILHISPVWYWMLPKVALSFPQGFKSLWVVLGHLLD